MRDAEMESWPTSVPASLSWAMLRASTEKAVAQKVAPRKTGKERVLRNWSAVLLVSSVLTAT
jgi:hypothetical protein